MKKLLLVASILALCLSLVLGVKAHPGRTDGNGGHTNRSTGEYHYHHGYSAHDHYDMDGDGDMDCPYEFKDKTDHSSGGGGGVGSGNNSDNYEDKENAVSIPQKPNTVTFFDVLKAMGSYLFLAIGIFFSSSYLLSFIFLPFLGDGKGCSVSLIAGGVITIIAYAWLIVASLT